MSGYNQGGGSGRAHSRRRPLYERDGRDEIMTSGKFEDAVDRQIRQAQEEGSFDNLSGKGKPFKHLDTDPLTGVLQAQGFTSRWVELDHDIRQKTEIAEQAVKRTYEWVK